MSDVGGIAADRLKSFVERIERLEEEKRGLQDDIKEIYAEAKGTGLDTKIIREIIRLRKMDKADRQEREALIELYKEALGMDIDHLFAGRGQKPTPLEVAIEVSKAKAGTGLDPETGEVGDDPPKRFDPVRALAEGIASGDERITKAASFPPGTTIEITPSSSRTDWPDDLPTRFVSDGGVMRPEAVQ